MYTHICRTAEYICTHTHTHTHTGGDREAARQGGNEAHHGLLLLSHEGHRRRDRKEAHHAALRYASPLAGLFS